MQKSQPIFYDVNLASEYIPTCFRTIGALFGLFRKNIVNIHILRKDTEKDRKTSKKHSKSLLQAPVVNGANHPVISFFFLQTLRI